MSIHWSAPIGFFVFFGFSVRPVGWLILAALILMHEWGHAAMVRRFGLFVHSIVLTGAGGECAWGGQATATERALIAWGGVFGQIPALLLGFALAAILPAKAPPLLAEAVTTLVEVNVMIMVFNLLPIPGLDGWEAWRLFAPSSLKGVGASLRRQSMHARRRKIERDLEDLLKKRNRR